MLLQELYSRKIRMSIEDECVVGVCAPSGIANNYGNTVQYHKMGLHVCFIQ